MDTKFFMQVVVPLSILLPVFIGVLRYTKLSKSARVVLLYLVISALFSCLALFVSKYLHKNNMPVTHLLTLIEFGMIIFFYKTLFGANKKNRFYNYIILLFAIVCIVNAIFFQSIYTYNSYTKSVEAIICMLFAMKYFAAIASGSPSTKIIAQPEFYFNVGFFLYFSGAFMLFVFSNFIITNLSLNNFLIIWTIHAALVLLMYLLFSIAFLLCKK